MALTPAEKQSNYRARKAAALAAELDALRARAEAAPAAPTPSQPVPHTPGPFADCTPVEVDYLKRMLEAFRSQTVAPIMQEATKMAEGKVNAEKAATKAAVRPASGTYWQFIRWTEDIFTNPKPMTGFIRIEITDTTCTGHREDVQQSGVMKLRYAPSKHRWQADGEPFYATKEEAEEGYWIEHPAPKPKGSRKQNPLKDKTVEELRRIRSANHPDKNASADHTLYQFAVEELDRRRG